jgi:hypothetical protein
MEAEIVQKDDKSVTKYCSIEKTTECNDALSMKKYNWSMRTCEKK